MVHSELRRIGTFECSDEMLNQLHRNVVWGLRGNFLDVPTDCPQRDERLGWTGDIAVFAPSASYLFDVEGFLRDWLLDLAAEQQAAEDGPVRRARRAEVHAEPEEVAQAGQHGHLVGRGGLGALGALVGVRRPPVLRDQFDSMAGHVRRVETLLSDEGLWDSGFQFGDWLDPTAPPDEPFLTRADDGVVATACLYRDAHIAQRHGDAARPIRGCRVFR